jgi:hypothetical protein
MKLMLGLPVFQTHIGFVPLEGPKKRVEQMARYMYIFLFLKTFEYIVHSMNFVSLYT